MDRIVVYGLGKLFKENFEFINNEYEVIAFADKDESKSEAFQNGVKVGDILKLDFDYILVASDNRRIAEELKNEIGIDDCRIKMLFPYLKDRTILGTYFAEDMEDFIVDRIFEKKYRDYSKITYIDIGACAGIGCSNTYYFYRRGARGILVDADSSAIRSIKQDRQGDIVINKAVCISADTEYVDFFVCNEDRALSSLNSKHVENWVNYNFTTRKERVQTVTINDLLHELNAPCSLLSIDIEGYDYEVINSMDFEKYHPEVIIIEMLEDGDRVNNGKIIELLESEGYVFYAKTRPNGIFVDKALLDFDLL